MTLRYANLLSPLQVGGVLLKNRMVSTAGIPHMLQGTEVYPTEKLITHMGNRAKNGAAAVYINFAMRLDNGPGGPGSPRGKGGVDMSFPPHDYQVNLADTASHNYLCQMIDMIRYYESIAITQPSGAMPREETGGPGGPGPEGHGAPFGSPDPIVQLREEQINCAGRSVDHISKRSIQALIDSTVENAKILKQFGFEMFSFHNAYHNGPVAEFWSADTNRRTDEYGGSVPNRARLLLEVFDAMKQTFGRDFPLECLISAEGPGVSIRDTIELARLAEGKIDILHIRHGEKDPQHPVGFTSTRAVPCPNLAAAAAVKEAVMTGGGRLLVGVSAGLQNADFNEKIIAEKKADLICMSRAWFADPEYGKKIVEGRGEDVTPCIRCNKCHVPNDSDKFRAFCSVNPILGIEIKAGRMVQPVTRKKKVAVVGGGPAGMKAALTCAERGHDVTLYEKENRLGGQLFHADYPSFKWPLADFRDWLIRQVWKSGVKVRLSTAATKQMLEAEDYDEVIVAIGPGFVRPDIPGADGPNTMLAIDVYGREKDLPQKIVVIGGSETGTETGMYLAENGHQVTVMTREPMLANDAAHAHYVVMLLDAYERLEGFDYVRNVKKYLAIDEKGVSYLDETGAEKRIDCDLVVLSGGVQARPAQAAAFFGAGKNTRYIGDCYRAGDVHKAVTAGYASACQI